MPDQVLSMTLSQFRAYAKGYENHLFDLECLMVHAGHWAGYYSNAKRPKPLGTILKELCEKRTKKQEQKSIEKPDVDVDEYLRREQSFNRRKRERERIPTRRRR